MPTVNTGNLSNIPAAKAYLGHVKDCIRSAAEKDPTILQAFRKIDPSIPENRVGLMTYVNNHLTRNGYFDKKDGSISPKGNELVRKTLTANGLAPNASVTEFVNVLINAVKGKAASKSGFNAVG